MLSDSEYSEFQIRLAENPEMGPVVPGGGGIRKVRLGFGGSGKRGGIRVIYYWAVRRDTILLLFAYAKNEMDNLTATQLRQLAKLVKEEFGDGRNII